MHFRYSPKAEYMVLDFRVLPRLLDLFQNKSHLLKLYKTLHPEDTTETETCGSTIYMDDEYFSKSFAVSGAKLSRIFSPYLSGLLQKQGSKNAEA